LKFDCCFFLAESSKRILSTDDDEQIVENDLSPPLILMNKQIELIHPLEHQWSFWYLKNQQGKDWQENLMKLATFGYVEEFWA
jgi:hypothetical protein